ncbi:hypothetical protein OROGR_031947 [Orobanche gracilis]
MDHQKSESGIDFLKYLETDTSINIMSFLDDPADLARASAVSRYWREFVIANKLTKQLCAKTFPQFYEIVDIVDTSRGETSSVGIKIENASGWEILKRDHKVYASLHQAITKSKVPVKDCIENAFSASSTDRFPSESIVNTLSPRDRFIRQASYWSSRGQSDPSVPETLVYKLKAGIWVITEICIQPFQAFFQPESPIYSSKSVRFRLGHPRPLSESGIDLLNLPLYEPADDMFQWTYTSPEFPMMQVLKIACNNSSYQNPSFASTDIYRLSCLAGFKDRKQMDYFIYGEVTYKRGMYMLFIYAVSLIASLCSVCFVRALGRSLFPAFDMEVLEPYGFKKLVLKHDPEKLSDLLESSSGEDILHLPHVEEEMWGRIGYLEELFHGFQQERDDNAHLEVDDD